MTKENQKEQSKSKLEFNLVFRKVVTVLGLLSAIFTTGLLIYEPAVQSSVINNTIIPAPTINPDISIVYSYQMKRNTKLPEELAQIQAELIVNTSIANKVPTSLLVAIIETESLFDPLATSSVGAVGLMQLYQSAKVTIDKNKAFNIAYNLQTGCEVLAEKLNNTGGDLPRALSAYSGGAKGYTDRVYEGIGRYEMFRYKNM